MRLDAGWVSADVHVGEVRAPLRSGSRRRVVAALDRWRWAPGGGEPVPAPRSSHLTGRAAAGARELPDAWADRVAAEPGERWLAAAATRSTRSLDASGGRVEDATIWVGLSDRRVVLAAFTDEATWSEPVRTPLRLEDRRGADRLHADERTLRGGARRTG